MPIRVSLFKSSQEPFCQLLDEHGVQYEHKLPPMGVPMASGHWITISENLSDPKTLGCLAAVIIAWIRSKATRETHVSLGDGKPGLITKGMSPEEVQEILKATTALTVFDTANQRSDGEGSEPSDAAEPSE